MPAHHSPARVDTPGRVTPFLSLVAAGFVPIWEVGTVAADPSLGLAVDLAISALMAACPLGAAAAILVQTPTSQHR